MQAPIPIRRQDRSTHQTSTTNELARLASSIKLVTAYLRFSPRPDQDNSPSNQQQLYLIKDWLADNYLPQPTKVFEDRGKSRDDMNRTGLWECAQATQKGLMVAYDLSRVGDVLAVETTVRLLERNHSMLATSIEGLMQNDPDSEFMRVLKGGMNRHQKRRMAENTSRHFVARLAMGKRVGNYPPIGAKFVLDPTGKKTVRGQPASLIVPDLEELWMIKRIQDMHNELGVGYRVIRRYMDREGATLAGKPLSNWFIRKALVYDLYSNKYGFIPIEVMTGKASRSPETDQHHTTDQ